MSEAAEKLMDGILEAWNTKDLETLRKYHVPDWIDHTQPDGMNNLAALEGMFGMFTAAFPDLELSIPKAVVNGNEVAYMYVFTGSHQGDFMGMPASGKEISVRGMTILNMDDGVCSEAWGVMDMMALMQQLGAIPS